MARSKDGRRRRGKALRAQCAGVVSPCARRFDATPTGMSTLVLLILCTLMPLLFAPALGSAQDQPEPQRDFPPLVSPDAPRSPYRDPTPPSPGARLSVPIV